MNPDKIKKTKELISALSDEKIKAALKDVLDLIYDANEEIDGLKEEIKSMSELVDSMDEDLAEVEDLVFDIDESEYDNVDIELECPDCKEIIILDSDNITEITCPNCGITIDIEYEDCECDDEDCEHKPD